MTRFYFHFQEGNGRQPDLEGIELSSESEAHSEAAARIMVSDMVLNNEPIAGYSFDISTAEGEIIETISVEEAIRFDD